MQTKICRGCNEQKPTECFHKAKKEKDGLQYRCISCSKKYHAARYAAQKDKINAQTQAYRAKNKSKLNEAGKLWRNSNKDKVKKYQRESNLKKNFGLSIEAYEKMAKEQNNLCAICLLPETFIHFATKKPANLSVDHCHKTGQIRRLLCSSCNKGLGLFNDSPELLLAAVAYLRDHSV